MLTKLFEFLAPGEKRSLRPSLKQLFYLQVAALVTIAGLGVWFHYPRYDWREVQSLENMRYHVQQMNNECLVDGRFQVDRYKTFVMNYPNRQRRFLYTQGPGFRGEFPLAIALLYFIPKGQITNADRLELAEWTKANRKELGFTEEWPED
ncbi:MAG: hypothetical protein P1V97_05195 [Planctomycetota bacterium]|nr:hypothetical protein [Planctomycetota bacterium]